MRTIAIMNLKGGVAKTTTTVNVAAILAHDHKKRVLVVDADSQCNTTEFFRVDPNKGNLARLLKCSRSGESFALQQIQNTDYDGVDMLAGSDALMDLDLSHAENGKLDMAILQKLARELEDIDRYDYCLIDCPPAFNAASAAALVAADEVLIPVKLDAFALQGMANLLRQIHNMMEINPGLRLLGCLPTMWYKGDNVLEAAAQLKAAGLPVLRPIRITRRVDDMTFAQRPLINSSPRSAAATDYRRLVNDLMRGAANDGRR